MSGAQSYLLDTDTASYITSGRSPAAREAFKRAATERPVLLSSISEAEILYGLELKPHAAKLKSSVHALLQSLDIRPWDSAAALAYSHLRTQLRTSGKALAHIDLLIASHAVALGAILVSHDGAFWHAMPHLSVVDWATDLKFDVERS